MANYNFDIRTDREQADRKRQQAADAKNKFVSRYALEAPKIEGGHNDILDGFVRGRPVKKEKKITIPTIPRDYNGNHVFQNHCSVATIINTDQDISSMVYIIGYNLYSMC